MCCDCISSHPYHILLLVYVCCLCYVGPNSKSALHGNLLVHRACTAGVLKKEGKCVLFCVVSVLVVVWLLRLMLIVMVLFLCAVDRAGNVSDECDVDVDVDNEGYRYFDVECDD